MFRFKMFGYLTAGVPSNDNKSNNPHYIFYFLANLLCAKDHICQINNYRIESMHCLFHDMNW